MRLGYKTKSNFILAFAALGIVFGDIGTSPTYAVSESMCATGSPHSPALVFGVASLIFLNAGADC
jgi:KUP system potassium uptake protein